MITPEGHFSTHANHEVEHTPDDQTEEHTGGCYTYIL